MDPVLKDTIVTFGLIVVGNLFSKMLELWFNLSSPVGIGIMVSAGILTYYLSYHSSKKSNTINS